MVLKPTREILKRHSFAIEIVPPFRLDLTVWALRRRPHNLDDRWVGNIYHRTLFIDSEPVEVAVEQAGGRDAPRLQVALAGARLAPNVERTATVALTRLLGLDRDLTAFYAFAATDERLDALARRFCGFRPPRFPTLFEALLNAVACQQITLTLGITLINRLAQAVGTAPEVAPDLHALPRPAELAGYDPDALRALGYSGQKARALVELAAAMLDGRLAEDMLEALDDAAAIEQLCSIRGVGRWTAEYALLRGQGRLHIFPSEDSGARNNLVRWLGLVGPLDYAGVRRILAPWYPYGGMIYLHLLLDKLYVTGML
jgi:DNA-3-methyladenine glycosylase II